MKKLFLFLFFCPSLLFCETSILSRFTLRQSFQTKSGSAEPATIAYTNPKEAKSSYLMNAAIGFNLFPESKAYLSIYPFVEYHRNTLIDKEQFNYLGGISIEWVPFDILKNKWSPVLISSAAYNNDKQKKIESFKGSMYLTLVFKWSSFNIFKTIFVEAFPYIGIENENRMKTEAIDKKGNIYRTFLRFNLSCNPFMAIGVIKERIEINLDLQHRYDFITPFKQLSRDHSYFLLSCSYKVYQSEDKKKSVEIGIEYVNGEDPVRGFEKQCYHAVILKMKL